MNNKARAVATILAGFLAGYRPCPGDVRLDGSLGPSESLSGPHYQIQQSYGQTVGTNLFHSFSAFDLNLGDSATFFGSPSIDNIIARVTGGTPSSIDGLISSAIPGASLWFINPNGVLFGPHASVDVDGSFYVSTANFLKFADGTRLPMTAGPPPVLTSAPPQAFGFLTDQPAPVAFFGSGSDAARQALEGRYAADGLRWNGMAVPKGRTFAVVAGDISLQDGRLYTGETVAGKLRAPSGRIVLVSVGSAGEVDPNAPRVDTGSFAREGKISLTSGVTPVGALLDVSGRGGGEIVIRGGTLVLRNALLVSSTTGDLGGKKIDIEVRGDLDAAGNGAGVYARTLGSGKAPDIVISAGNLRLSDTAAVVSATGGAGAGGDIRIRAEGVELSQGSGIVSLKGNGSSGKGGRIDIEANAIVLKGVSGIGSFVGNASQGEGGAIYIGTGELTILGGSSIFSNSGTDGTARGGAVTIEATGTIKLADGRSSQSGIFSNAADGDAGTLTISARNLVLENGGTIGADNFGAGRGADIVIHAKTVTLSSDSTNPNSFALISAKPSEIPGSGRTPSGAPGNILITADTVRFSGPRSGITTANLGTTDAGDVTITAGSLEMADGSRIEGSTLGRGRASDLRLIVNRLDLRGGAAINSSSSSRASGRAGDIEVLASEGIDIGGDSIDSGGVYSTALGSGDAGKILIRTSELRIAAYGEVSTSTAGGGRGGDILILDADRVVISGPGGIFSRTVGNADAGDIHVNAEVLSVSGAGEVNAGTEGAGHGGTIRITAGRFNLGPNGTVSVTSRGTGRGGDIRIAAGQMGIEGGSVSALSSGAGDAGNISIDAGEHLISRGGRVTAQADHAGGGNIHIAARNRIHLVESEITASVQGGSGGGGNVFLDPQWVILDHSRIVANAFYGPGGNIHISAGQFLRSGDSVVDASSRFGLNGNILVQSPETNILGKTKILAAQYRDPATLFRTPCAARYAQGESSLAIRTAKIFGPPPGEGLFAVDDEFESEASGSANGAATPADSDCARHGHLAGYR